MSPLRTPSQTIGFRRSFLILLLLAVIFVPLCVLALSTYFYIQVQIGEQKAQSMKIAGLPLTLSDQTTFCLQLRYPEQLLLIDDPGGTPLTLEAVRLPVPITATHHLSSVKPFFADECLINSISDTEVISTPMRVAIEPTEDIEFTDELGRPLSLEIGPLSVSSVLTHTAIYAHQVSTEHNRSSAKIGVWLVSETNDYSKFFDVAILLENRISALKRYAVYGLVNNALSVTLGILGILAAITVVAYEYMLQAIEKDREKRQEDAEERERQEEISRKQEKEALEKKKRSKNETVNDILSDVYQSVEEISGQISNYILTAIDKGNVDKFLSSYTQISNQIEQGKVEATKIVDNFPDSWLSNDELQKLHGDVAGVWRKVELDLRNILQDRQSQWQTIARLWDEYGDNPPDPKKRETLNEQAEKREALIWFLTEHSPEIHNLKWALSLLNSENEEFVLRTLRERLWQTYVSRWSHLTFHHAGKLPSYTIKANNKSEFPDLEINPYPFRVTKAEIDPWIQFPLPRADSLEPYLLEHMVYIGVKGAGKTYRALHHAKQSLQHLDNVIRKQVNVNECLFPVYWPVNLSGISSDLLVSSLADATTRSIFALLSVHPQLFLQTNAQHQSAIARLLLWRWKDSNVLLKMFQQSHRGHSSEILKLCQQIDMLWVKDSDVSSLIDDNELLALISSSCPVNHLSAKYASQMLILTDIQEVDDSSDQEIESVLRLLGYLAETGAVVHVYTYPNHSSVSGMQWLGKHVHLQLSEGLLRRIFDTRLTHTLVNPQMDTGIDFEIFFKPEVANGIEEEMMRLSNGSPGRLLEISQFFVNRFEERQDVLDLDDIDEMRAEFQWVNHDSR